MEQLSVVKIGGKIIEDDQLLEQFLTSFSKIEGKKIIVHGGGRKATSLQKSLDIPVQMIDGRRITDADTLEVVTMVYAGLVNKNLVAKLQMMGIDAIGLSGADANVIQAHKRKKGEIDYGFAGDIDFIRKDMINRLMSLSLLPVFCPITHDKKGQLLNTNADTIANHLAVSFSPMFAVDLKFCFEYNGVLSDLNDDQSLLSSITRKDAKTGITDGTFSDGMIPKLDNAFEALKNGVQRLFICGIDQVHEDTPGTQILL